MPHIIRMQFGSRLYGTATPDSDRDYKAVIIPTGHDILLQRVKASVSHGRLKAKGEKNAAGEIDEEHFSLQRYLELVTAGHPAALDMLFAPESAWTDEPSWQWREILDNRERIVTRESLAIVDYVRSHAGRYDTGKSRGAAVNAALALLEGGISRHGSAARLERIGPSIEALTGEQDHMRLVRDATRDGKAPDGTKALFWQVCGRKMGFTSSLASARDVMDRLAAEQERRSHMARCGSGADWKPLSHALRIARQAVELFETGSMTLPRPDAAHLLDIKLGRLPYGDICEELAILRDRLDAAVMSSCLADRPDPGWIDDFVAGCYRDAVLDWRPSRCSEPQVSQFSGFAFASLDVTDGP